MRRARSCAAACLLPQPLHKQALLTNMGPSSYLHIQQCSTLPVSCRSFSQPRHWFRPLLHAPLQMQSKRQRPPSILRLAATRYPVPVETLCNAQTMQCMDTWQQQGDNRAQSPSSKAEIGAQTRAASRSHVWWRLRLKPCVSTLRCPALDAFVPLGLSRSGAQSLHSVRVGFWLRHAHLRVWPNSLGRPEEAIPHEWANGHCDYGCRWERLVFAQVCSPVPMLLWPVPHLLRPPAVDIADKWVETNATGGLGQKKKRTGPLTTFLGHCPHSWVAIVTNREIGCALSRCK